MDFKSILLAQKTGYIPRNHFDALFARRIGGAVLKDFPGLPASIVTVTDALAKPLDSLKVAITPVQSGSGDPSPDNIRPISGWTECNVWRTGKNLFDKTAVTSGKYMDVNGNDVNSLQWSISDYIRIDSGFIYSGLETVTPSPYSAFYDGDKTLMQTFKQKTGDNVVSVPTGAEYVRFSVRNSDIDTFKVFTGTDYTITFPSEAGTVYGGTLDVTNGTLTVERAFIKGGWSQYNSSNGYKAYRQNAPLSAGATQYGSKAMSNIISKYGAFSSSSMSENIIQLPYPNTTIIFIALQEDLNVNDLEISYSVATPQTYHLTPTKVQMLLGTNNIWADTGDILEGKYYAKK